MAKSGRRWGVFVVAAVSATAGFSPAQGDSTFQPLDFAAGTNFSELWAMTPDGTAAIGQSGARTYSTAWRWTATGGSILIPPIPTAPVGDLRVIANAISTDGRYVAGTARDTVDYVDVWEAFRWDANSGRSTGLGFLSLSGAHSSYGNDQSSDGKVVVGKSSYGPDFLLQAFRWDEVNGMTPLGGLASSGDPSSEALAISADGTTIVGWSKNSDVGPPMTTWTEATLWKDGSIVGLGYAPGSARPYSSATLVSDNGGVVAGEAIFTDSSGDWNGAFVWTESGGFVGLGYLADSATPAVIATRPRTMASAISADGSAIVGSSVRSDGNYEAFRWSDGAIEGLGVLASATHPTSIATAASANGKVVVGYAVNDEGSGDFVDAFRWSEAGGIESLGEWLGPSVDLSTVTSRQASAVSADGNTIGGTMVRDGYTQAFIARVGGIIAPEDAAASFAATSSTTTDADRSVADDATAGRECRTFGPNGLCLFGRLEAGLNNGTDHPVSGTFGAAARFGVRSRAGLALGNLDRAFDLEFDGHVHEVGPIVSAYAGWGMDDETGPQLFAAASSGWLDAETQRGYVNGSATAVSTGRANIGAAVLTSRAAFGFRVAPALIASPWAGLSQSWTHEAAYAEEGGPFPAAFSERGTDTLTSRLGFDASVSIGAGCRLTASAGWAHTLVSHADPISGSMDGLDISVPGALPASDWGEASIGVDLNASAHARISTGISGAFGGGMDRLALNVGFQDGF